MRPGWATVAAAAAGRLPSWAEVGAWRLGHIRRVAGLLGQWAGALGLAEPERERWLAAGWLHDALRDADPDALRRSVPLEQRERPGSMLHGPAVAARLREQGVDDEDLLNAIAYHTFGHPDLGRLGKALYLADFLEPGRAWQPAWRAALRARLPDALDDVLIDVAAARITHLLRRRQRIWPETHAFWNSLTESS